MSHRGVSRVAACVAACVAASVAACVASLQHATALRDVSTSDAHHSKARRVLQHMLQHVLQHVLQHILQRVLQHVLHHMLQRSTALRDTSHFIRVCRLYLCQ